MKYRWSFWRDDVPAILRLVGTTFAAGLIAYLLRSLLFG
jgi:hypothetical protein